MQRLRARKLRLLISSERTPHMTDGLAKYYNFPESLVRLVQNGELKNGNGYFRFGSETCYGQCSGLSPASALNGSLVDTLPATTSDHGTVSLPFDLAQVVDNLRNE